MGTLSGDGYYQDVDEARYGGDDFEEYYAQINHQKMCNRHGTAKRAEIGATIQCANCGRNIVKKTYQQRFCPPIKAGKKKRYVCKDNYNNIINPRGKFARY